MVDKAHIAVDMFFAMSGFVMYLAYINKAYSKNFSYYDFIIRRIARIYPVHIVTLTIAVAMFTLGGYFGLTTDASLHLRDTWAHLFMVHGWGMTDDIRLNYPSWSISAEFFGYLLFPFMFLAFVKLDWRTLLVAVVAFVIAYYCIYMFFFEKVLGKGLFELTYNFSIIRVVPGFALGIAMAHAALRLPPIRLSWLLTGLSVTAAALLASLNDALMVVGAALVLGILYLANPRIPRWMVYVGTLSFSIYMCHGLVEMTGFKLGERFLGWAEGGAPLWSLPVMVLAAMLGAVLLHYFVEKPGWRFVLGLAKSRTSRIGEVGSSR